MCDSWVQRGGKFCELWNYVWWTCHGIPEWRVGQWEELSLIMRGFDKPSGLSFRYPHWEILAHPEAQRNCPFFSPISSIILAVCLNLSVTPNRLLTKELCMGQVTNSTYRYQIVPSVISWTNFSELIELCGHWFRKLSDYWFVYINIFLYC